MQRLMDHVSSVGLALTLTVGIAAAWLVVCMSFVIPFTAKLVRPLVGDTRVEEAESWFVHIDGTIVVCSSKGDYHTLDGKPVRKNNGIQMSHYTLPASSDAGLPYQRLPWRERIQSVLVSRGAGGAAYWHAIHDGEFNGHAYFVGYSADSRRLVGYIGRDGYREDLPPTSDQFCVSGRDFRNALIDIARPHEDSCTSADYLKTASGLVEIDFEHREVKLLMDDPTLCFMGRVTLYGQSGPERPSTELVLVRNAERIVLFDRFGKQVRNYCMPTDIAQRTIDCYLFDNGKAIVEALPSRRENHNGTWPQNGPDNHHTLYWFDADGKMVRQQQFTLKGGKPSLKSKQDAVDTFARFRGVDRHTGAILMALSYSSLPGISIGGVFFAWSENQDTLLGLMSTILLEVADETRSGIVALCVVSVVLGVLTHRRQRRFGQPWAWSWAIFVLLFGLPGYFGYLFHQTWPALLPCPHCGCRVPRNRPTCPKCGKEFPVPSPKGIELFA